jgi:hypothetical protein
VIPVYRLPPKFHEDHRCRDLPEEGHSAVIRETKTAVFVEMDEAAFRDLYSDADYYTDAATAAQMGMPGLAASARATLKALRAQNPTLVEAIEDERRLAWRPGNRLR